MHNDDPQWSRAADKAPAGHEESQITRQNYRLDGQEHSLPGQFYSVPEWAKIANVSTSTVRREIARGNLRACKIGNQIRIPADAAAESIRWIPSIQGGA